MKFYPNDFVAGRQSIDHVLEEVAMKFSRVLTPSRRQGNAILREWCPGVTGRVLSLGSGNDSDKDGRRYRDYFTAAESYLTSELGGGDCDLDLDIRDMHPIADGAYDCLFCHSVLEHVDDFYAALAECSRILKSGGVFLLGVPFRYHIHRAPDDYWRFTEYGIAHMLAQAGFWVEEIVGVDGPEDDPAFYWTRARKV